MTEQFDPRAAHLDPDRAVSAAALRNGPETAAYSPSSAAQVKEPLIELRGLSKRYRGIDVIADLSITARRGEILALLGDNGAGKSTLVKMISGLVQPDSGEIRWEGAPVTIATRHVAGRLGIETIFQDTAMIDSMSIYRNIFLGRELRGRLGLMRAGEMRRITAEILETIVGIKGIDSPDKPVRDLSGGQRQAVAIARAVHFNRQMLVLDEPTSALAVSATEALFDYLRSLRESGLSSILVTHNLYHAFELCDRFVVLGHGKLLLNAAKADTSVRELTDVLLGAT